ncbi:MAG TPA: AMP-binding protein, partial [Beutenbergiaceae bacterium]|nr:AMP-binding protein [Beutenbergiaceae bacterium]
MTEQPNPALANLLTEERRFPPSPEFAAQANFSAQVYDDAARDRLAFWATQARAHLDWHTPFTHVLDWSQAPRARWFHDGRLNATYNALDRHVANGLGNRVALLFEGEPGDSRAITYAELLEQVKKAANVLQSLGVETGDRVAIYMPMIPEAVVAMLACARIGAPHSVVFGGFSADALHSRIVDANARVVITSDGGYRRGKPSSLKPAVDAALNHDDNPVEHVVVVERTGQGVDMVKGRDQWWHDLMASASSDHEAIPVEAEHPLYVLYTSGTTGKPKGVLHTTGGYLAQCAFTHSAVFDLKPESDVYWCT